MEPVPAYVYIHPIWQAITFLVGLYLSAVGLRNTDNPNFSVRRHKRIGRVFLIMVIAGAIFGKLITASLPSGTLRMPGHTFLAVAVVLLVVVGAIFGYQGERKRLRVKTGMMRAHPWFIILATALIFAQGLVGLRGLGILKF